MALFKSVVLAKYVLGLLSSVNHSYRHQVDSTRFRSRSNNPFPRSDHEDSIPSLPPKQNSSGFICHPLNDTSTESQARLRQWLFHVTRGQLSAVELPVLNEGPVLVQACCVRGRWPVPFNPRYTRREFFYGHPHVLTVATMHARGLYDYAYSRGLRAQLLRLPCGSGISLVLLLPSEAGPRALTQLECTLNAKVRGRLQEKKKKERSNFFG